MKNWIKKLFIPHTENNHRPLFLEKTYIKYILFFVIFLEIFFFLIPTISKINQSGGLASVLPSILNENTNNERVNLSLNKLKVSEDLNKVAQLKADDMAQNGYFAHTSPEGKTPWFWFNEVGYKYKYAGENLAINFNDSSDVSAAWMNSESHKANIIKGNYEEIGTGVAKGLYNGKETLFVAQVYASKAKILTTEKNLVSENSNKSSDNVLGAEVIKLDEVLPNIPLDELSQKTTDELISLSDNNPTFFQKIFSAPRSTASKILFIISFIVTLAIFLNIFIEIKHHHIDLVTNGLFLLAVLGILFLSNFYLSNKNMVIIQSLDQSEENNLISYCYFEKTYIGESLYDKKWMTLNINGNKISGNVFIIPAQTDSKKGDFYGSIFSLDENNNDIITAGLIWNAEGEGIKNKEDLLIKYNNDGVQIGYGEMIEVDNNYYQYKDKNNIFYTEIIPRVDCAELNSLTN